MSRTIYPSVVVKYERWKNRRQVDPESEGAFAGAALGGDAVPASSPLWGRGRKQGGGRPEAERQLRPTMEVTVGGGFEVFGSKTRFFTCFRLKAAFFRPFSIQNPKASVQK